AVFSDKADFDFARISGPVSFRVVESEQGTYPVLFRKEARFFGVIISGNANFNGVRFLDRADFRLAQVDGRAWFSSIESRLPKGTVMRSLFGGPALFRGIRIKDGAYFDGVEFADEASFNDCQIGGTAYFGFLGLDSAEGATRIIPVLFQKSAD